MDAMVARCLAECCGVAEAEPAVIFSRRNGCARPTYSRAPGMVEKREEVWALMRAWRTRADGGIGLSWPQIARATGAPNHSTVITAVQRRERRIAEGK